MGESGCRPTQHARHLSDPRNVCQARPQARETCSNHLNRTDLALMYNINPAGRCRRSFKSLAQTGSRVKCLLLVSVPTMSLGRFQIDLLVRVNFVAFFVNKAHQQSADLAVSLLRGCAFAKLFRSHSCPSSPISCFMQASSFSSYFVCQ